MTTDLCFWFIFYFTIFWCYKIPCLCHLRPSTGDFLFEQTEIYSRETLHLQPLFDFRFAQICFWILNVCLRFSSFLVFLCCFLLYLFKSFIVCLLRNFSGKWFPICISGDIIRDLDLNVWNFLECYFSKSYLPDLLYGIVDLLVFLLIFVFISIFVLKLADLQW